MRGRRNVRAHFDHLSALPRIEARLALCGPFVCSTWHASAILLVAEGTYTEKAQQSLGEGLFNLPPHDSDRVVGRFLLFPDISTENLGSVDVGSTPT